MSPPKMTDREIYDMLRGMAIQLDMAEGKTKYGDNCLQSASFAVGMIAATIIMREERKAEDPPSDG